MVVSDQWHLMQEVTNGDQGLGSGTYGEGRKFWSDGRLLENVFGVRHAGEHGGRDGSGNSVEPHDGAVSPTKLGEENLRGEVRWQKTENRYKVGSNVPIGVSSDRGKSAPRAKLIGREKDGTVRGWDLTLRVEMGGSGELGQFKDTLEFEGFSAADSGSPHSS